MEFLRVYSRKSFLLIMVALILANIAIYVKAQKDVILYDTVSSSHITRLRTELIREYSSMTMDEAYRKNTKRLSEINIISQLSMYHLSKEQNPDEYTELFASNEASLRKDYPDISKEYDLNPRKYSEEYFYVYITVLSEIKRQQTYIMGFPRYIEKIEEQTKSSGTISIFNNDTSFTKKSITKTIQDFQRIKYVPLIIGNNEVLESIVKHDTAQFLILLFILFLLLGFLDERKAGLWTSVHSTKNGRRELAFRRCGILLISIIGINVVMYASLLITSLLMHGDWNDLFRNVQSIEMFSGLTLTMTVLGFTLWYIVVKIITSLAVAMFIWLVFSFTYRLNLGIAIVSLSLASEWAIYHYLPVQSNFNILKYINLFCYINVSQDIIGYRNINFFSLAISRTTLILLSSLILSLLLLIFCIFVNDQRKPHQKSNSLIEKIYINWFSHAVSLFHKGTESLGVIAMEIYKVLFANKGILILAALCCFLYSGINSTTMYYSPSDYIVNGFYKEYSGLPTEEAEKHIGKLKAEISTTEREYSDAYMKYEAGVITYADLEGFKYKLNANENTIKALTKIDNNNQYLNTLAENRNINGWFVNPRAYDHLIGEKGYQSQSKYALLALFCLILLLSSVFSFEYKCNMKKLLHSTVNGRKYLFIKKMKGASIITFMIWILVYGSEVFNINQLYGITCLGAPVQSLQMMEDSILHCSIGTFLILIYSIRLLLLLAISFVICYLSGHLQQSTCMIFSSILFLIPALLTILGIEVFKYLSVVQVIIMMRNLFQSNQFGQGLIPSMTLLTMGGIGFFLAKIKWCETV